MHEEGQKDWIEDLVTDVLRYIIGDSENLMSLAVDAAALRALQGGGYLESLRRSVRKLRKASRASEEVIEGRCAQQSTLMKHRPARSRRHP